MKEFQLSRYIKKWLPLIIVVCIALTVSVYFFLSASQTYVASAVIQYNGNDAVNGLNPDGTELDVSEFKSSSLMTEVIENLGLDSDEYSVDNLISKIQITEVIDEDEQERKDALLELGEEYTYEPTRFVVSFEAEAGEGSEFARKVLDEILDVYFAKYSESHINYGSTLNTVSGIYEDNYDYIEMVELINTNISDTLTTLSKRVSNNQNFRSVTTGYSFSDLATEFNYIRSVEIPSLFSRIFEYQVTKDKNLLVSKFRERIKENDLSGQEAEKKIEDVEELIGIYVEKMRESGNTNIGSEYILDELHDKNLVDAYGEVIGEGDQTVTYDKLIYSWRDHNDTDSYSVIDTAYCNYVINIFNSCTGADGAATLGTVSVTKNEEAGEKPQESVNEEIGLNVEEETTETGDIPDILVETVENTSPCAYSDLTCAALNTPGYDEIVATIQNDIQELLAELDELYLLVEATNSEYNEYLGAANISTLSTASVEESVNVRLYTALAAVFFLVICCSGAVLVGRMNDIIQYIFFMDRSVGLNNRLAFDRYLSSRDKRLLGYNTVCFAISLKNQKEINKEYGRENGDKLIKFFADSIKLTLAEEKRYIAYNGSGQFFAFAYDVNFDQAENILQYFRLLVDKRDVLKEADIEYEVGMAHTGHENTYKIRGILSIAVGNQKKFISKALQ